MIMDVRKSKEKYLKLLNYLRKKELAKELREKKGFLPLSIVEEAYKEINILYKSSSVEKLNSIIQKNWKKISEDALSTEPDDAIITISRQNIAKRNRITFDAITNYVVKTKDLDFLKGKIRRNLVKNAMLEYLGVESLRATHVNTCRNYVHENHHEIKEAVFKRLKPNKEFENNSDSDWSEVSDIEVVNDNLPINNISRKRKISIKEEVEPPNDIENVIIKTEPPETDEESITVNETTPSSCILKEVRIPLERIQVPVKEISKTSNENKTFSRWYRMVSDDEFLHEKKKDFLAQYQHKKIKLINECQMAVQNFITDCDQALEELFTNVKRSYRKQPNIKVM
ncbi:uncharacterized protein LOC122510988 [Leptopilina heterotoma]|uniref:uncharacterized protein LOC122510988 n=1 Tax=Leptopilina heterotoma TaxID=63436 RepID=UPI001CA7F092|nr:uncharacterized protein LOC122510988 [Leptopilina heterotoma]